MQTKNLATAFMAGVLSVLILTVGSFQSAYAMKFGTPQSSWVSGAGKIGDVSQHRLNQATGKLIGPKTPSGKQYVGNQSKLRRPSSKYPGLK